MNWLRLGEGKDFNVCAEVADVNGAGAQAYSDNIQGW